MRIVLDTNILISALLSKLGPPGRVLDVWLEDERYDLVTSDAQIAELRRVFTYDRLKDRIRSEDALRLLHRLKIAILAGELPQVNLSPDPPDNVIIATAIAGKVDLIVTGDRRHLLSLGQVAEIPIITARQFASRLGLDNEPGSDR